MTEKAPLFSVLIPVYNAEKYLDRCMESVLNQTEQDFEVLLVDDCSTDSSYQMCQSYVDRYPSKIRLIRHERNKGLLLTRRTHFYHARGEWFVSVDADDWLALNALQILKEKINSIPCDLILYDLTCIGLDGKGKRFHPDLQEEKLYAGEEKRKIYYELIQGYAINSICTKAMHRSIIDYDVDYDQFEFVRHGTDIFQSFPIIDNAQRIVYIDQSLYSYQKTEGSITTRFIENDYEINKELWKRYDAYFEKWDIDKEVIAKHRVGRLIFIIQYLISLLENKSKFQLYAESISADASFHALFLNGFQNQLNKSQKQIISLLYRGNITLLYGVLSIYAGLISFRRKLL